MQNKLPVLEQKQMKASRLQVFFLAASTDYGTFFGIQERSLINLHVKWP